MVYYDKCNYCVKLSSAPPKLDRKFSMGSLKGTHIRQAKPWFHKVTANLLSF